MQAGHGFIFVPFGKPTASEALIEEQFLKRNETIIK